ncbi:MAG TPA: sporulation protein YjcZ [Firmicutes bacterium]|nr:sporulation protein YjcZ [Bacillota bacterium]
MYPYGPNCYPYTYQPATPAYPQPNRALNFAFILVLFILLVIVLYNNQPQPCMGCE